MGLSRVRCGNCGLLFGWERLEELEMQFQMASNKRKSIWMVYCRECADALRAFLADAYSGNDRRAPILLSHAY